MIGWKMNDERKMKERCMIEIIVLFMIRWIIWIIDNRWKMKDERWLRMKRWELQDNKNFTLCDDTWLHERLMKNDWWKMKNITQCIVFEWCDDILWEPFFISQCVISACNIFMIDNVIYDNYFMMIYNLWFMIHAKIDEGWSKMKDGVRWNMWRYIWK
jgi:hypothetical protein